MVALSVVAGFSRSRHGAARGRTAEMRQRKSQSDAPETSDGHSPVTKGRREGRGWGPFSGGQLATVIIAVVVMAMLPVGAFAVVSGSNAFVTDATTGKHAAVNSAGALTVAPAATNALFTGIAINFATFTCASVVTPPAGKALVVTSIEVSYLGSTGAEFEVTATTTAACGGFNLRDLYSGKVSGGPTTLNVPFGSGVAIKNGNSIAVSANGNGTTRVYVYGYLVPAGACSNGCI